MEYFIPFGGKCTHMGNDFYAFFCKHKIYLLAHLANGYPALWSPSEAAGFPFFSSPLAQYFYPFNALLVLWYKLAGGYGIIDHQLFTIFGLSILGLGLFYWLKLLNGNLRAALFSVLIMTVSFRLTESLRFPNGIHTAAWYPWILYALTRVYMTSSLKKMIAPCLILFFSTLCMITGGYPYFVYYSIFLLVPYVLMLSLRPTRMTITGQYDISWKAVLPALGLSGCVILLFGMPYLIGIKRLTDISHSRSGNDFNYSTHHAFTAQDSLGALIYPPLSQMEGWYYFSLTGLLLVLLFFVWLFLSPRNTALPSNSPYSMRLSSRKHLCLILLAWIALISYISYGSESYLFKLLWQYMPGFSNLRAWGRLNIILIPLIAWLLAMAYDAFETIIQNQWAGAGSISKKSKISLILIVTGFYFIILYTQLYLYINNINDPYWKMYSAGLINLRIWFLVLGGLGFLILLSLLIWGRWLAGRMKYYRVLVFTGLWLVAAVEMWPVGAHIWSYRAAPPKRIQIDPAPFHLEAFNKPRINVKQTVFLKPVYTIGLGSPTWYFESYVRFLYASEREKENRDMLMGIKDGRRIFLSEKLAHTSIFSFLKDSLRFQNTGNLVSYTGDELIWELDMPINGYLSFMDNWDPYWKAYADGREIPMELLFDTFKSVPLTQGKHRVIFRYEPTLKTVIFGTN
jgi:hypothetical protein